MEKGLGFGVLPGDGWEVVTGAGCCCWLVTGIFDTGAEKLDPVGGLITGLLGGGERVGFTVDFAGKVWWKLSVMPELNDERLSCDISSV